MGVNPELLIAPDYVMVRMALVDDLDGNFPAAILLQRLDWRQELRPEGYRATVAELAAETRLSEHQVKASLRVLRERGYIEGTREDRYDPTQTWRVVRDVRQPLVKSESDFTVKLESDLTVTAKSDLTLLSETGETKDRDTPLPPEGERASGAAIALVDDRFERAWKVWPRKEDKKAARRAWTKAEPIAQRQGISLVETVIAHGEAFRSWPETEWRFVPYLASWLNGEKWNNPLPQPRHEQSTDRVRDAAIDTIAQARRVDAARERGIEA